MKQKMSILFSALALGACAGVGYEPATPEFQRAIASALGHKKARPIPAVAISDQWKLVTDELVACVRSDSKYEMYVFTKGVIVYSNPDHSVCKSLQSYRPLPPI